VRWAFALEVSRVAGKHDHRKKHYLAHKDALQKETEEEEERRARRHCQTELFFNRCRSVSLLAALNCVDGPDFSIFVQVLPNLSVLL